MIFILNKKIYGVIRLIHFYEVIDEFVNRRKSKFSSLSTKVHIFYGEKNIHLCQRITNINICDSQLIIKLLIAR